MAGISTVENKREVMGWIDELEDINRVLDVGAGQGIWSILLRQPEQYWTAIEVFYPYAKMFDLREKYDQIFVTDVRYVDFMKIGMWWDLTILADVLEHMLKEQAKDVITELLTRSKYLLISVPVQHNSQHAGDEGNDFETHLDHWTDAEMGKFIGEFHETHQVINHVVGEISAYYLVKTL